jgi:NAD(P)-dependent dehydrogenase (short-subunit alcohol dehydrogenase family)
VRPLVITGGSRGIGAATAKLAAARGYAVCVGYHSNHAAAEDVVGGIRDAGGTALAVACDVTVEADVLRLFETSDRELGPLAGLVNNAGVVAAKSRVETMSAERLQRMFAVNTIGPILCAREAVRRMSTRHGGRGGVIVNVSSAASRLGSADEYVDYAASKGAIDSFTLGLAREIAMDGIRVNAVRPGIVETEIHASGGQPDRVARIGPLVPMQRAGRVDEIAHAILWLLSDEASYTTGALLDVSGGR